MTASMTAFCRHQTDQPAGSLIWEVRSVNHRYLDTHLKLPEELKAIEPACRERITAQLNRGRVDAMLKYEPAIGSELAIEVNSEALARLGKALSEVERHIVGVAPANAADILRWPGVLEEQRTDQEQLGKAALTALNHALEALVDSRLREGGRLAALILERIVDCRKQVADLIAQLPEIELDLKQRWQRRLDELGDDVDPARIAQEQALLLTRNDVSEELDRLQTHFDEVERVIGQNKPAGRRLDFLMQELNREANTLGSKSVDLRNTTASVELKVLIDQMREQVQNIE